MRPSGDTHLYLIRHGETDYNRLRMVQGRGVNSDLNEIGRRQAEALALRAVEFGVDVIYASTLNRAYQTARLIADRTGHDEIRQLADLEEMSWGIYEGQPRTPELREALHEMQRRWDAGEYAYAVPGGESIYDVQRRGLAAIDQIVAAHPGDRVLVVTHGRLLRIVLASLLEEVGLERMESLSHRNTAVNHLVFSGNRYEARLLDCIDHLEAAGIPEGEK